MMNAIENLMNRQAAGGDGITAEILKCGGLNGDTRYVGWHGKRAGYQETRKMRSFS